MSATLRGGALRLTAAMAVSSKWNLVFPRGEWHGPNLASIGGSIVIDDAMLREVVANWQAAGKPPLPVRKTHAHLDEADPVKRLELEKAVGLLADMRVTAQGLEVLTEWNDAGVAAVQSGEWNFWSPEWAPQHTDRRTGDTRGWWLSGVALTNDPFFHTMPAVAASTAIPPGSPTGKPNKGQSMNYAKIAAALGMPEDSTEEAILAECSKMKASSGAMQASLTAAVQKAVQPVELQLKAATERIATIEAEKAKAAEALFERDVHDVIESAKREGYACEPMRASIALVAKASGLDEAKKLARSASKLAASTTGTGGATPVDVLKASVTEYNRLVDEQVKAGMSAAAAAKSVISTNPELAAKAFSSLNG
jgi:phage I-like protein